MKYRSFGIRHQWYFKLIIAMGMLFSADLWANDPIADSFYLPLAGNWNPSRGFAKEFISDWRGFHLGDDIPVPADTPVYSTAKGVVVFAAEVVGYTVIIEHQLPDGTFVTSVYYHMKLPKHGGILLIPGDIVGPSMPLGHISGRYDDHKSSPHLHFGIRTGSFKPVQDPRTEKWFYPGYTAIYRNGVRQNDQSDPTHAEIIAEWNDPLKFIEEHASRSVILQPGPTEGKDIWTTSVYSYAAGGSYPGGGLNDHKLLVGGWGDLYYSLLQLDLTVMPANVASARLELFCYSQHDGYGTTGIYLDRIAQFWDWKTQGTGRDRERLWWADRPAAVQWIPQAQPAPIVGQWYSIDITDLYNAWQNGDYPNYGIQLRPANNNNYWAEFYSSDYMDDPLLRPKLVIER